MLPVFVNEAGFNKKKSSDLNVLNLFFSNAFIFLKNQWVCVCVEDINRRERKSVIESKVY